MKGGKHAYEKANNDVVELVKCAKFLNRSWAAVPQLQFYRVWHKNAEFVDHHHVHYADGPSGDMSPQTAFIDELPPISLQYEGFGYFLDIIYSNKEVPGINKVSSARLHLAVDDFAEQMSLIYI